MTSQWSICRNEIEVSTVAGTRTWAAGCGPVLQSTLIRMQQGSKYGAHLVDLQQRFDTFIQTYACRSIRGGGVHSEHSHPVATDLWPGANPMSDRGLLITNFDLFGAADGEAFLHSIMDPLPGVGRGIWQWGGGLYSADINVAIGCYRRRGHVITRGRVDAMHFELDDWVDAGFVSHYDWSQWTEGEFTLDAEAKAAFADLGKQVAALQKDVKDLQASSARNGNYLDGVAAGLSAVSDAGKDATAVERGGFRIVRAAMKTLGLAPGK